MVLRHPTAYYGSANAIKKTKFEVALRTHWQCVHHGVHDIIATAVQHCNDERISSNIYLNYCRHSQLKNDPALCIYFILTIIPS